MAWPVPRYVEYVYPTYDCDGCDLSLAPTGYAVLAPITPADGPTLPLLGAQPGAWFRSSGLPLSAIGEIPNPHPYIPTSSPSGIAGGGLFGGGGIGHRRAYHDRLEASLVDGFEVYEPVPSYGLK